MVAFWCFNKIFQGINLLGEDMTESRTRRSPSLSADPKGRWWSTGCPERPSWKLTYFLNTIHKTCCAHPPASPSTPCPRPSEPSALLWVPTTRSPQVTGVPLVHFPALPACLSPCRKMQHCARSQHCIADALPWWPDCMHVNGGGASNKSRLCINRNQSDIRKARQARVNIGET